MRPPQGPSRTGFATPALTFQQADNACKCYGTGNKPVPASAAYKGFTLLELLIVIVLIGIMGSLATLSMRSGTQRDQQRQEAERMVALFGLASQEAMVRAMPLAVQCHRHGYRFLHLTEDGWQAVSDDAVFRARELGGSMSLTLMLNKQPVTLAETVNANGKPEAQIIFTPDGDMDVFQIALSVKDSDEIFTVTHTAQEGLSLASRHANEPPR